MLPRARSFRGMNVLSAPPPGFSLASRRGLPVLLLALWAAAPALAQPASPCVATLEVAQANYVNQEFAQAEALLRECLNRPDMDDQTAIAVHRLLTLVYLRQDDLAEARQSVVRLLGVSFEYEPDPVEDPPAYVALVESIKEQLRVEREAVALPEEPVPPEEVPRDSVAVPAPLPVLPPPPVEAVRAYRAGPALHAYATVGAGSYGGERGRAADWLVGEFTANSGVTLSLGASFCLNPTVAAALTYRLHHIPRLLTLRSADRNSPVMADRENPIREDDSSKWVHLVALLGRAYYRPLGRSASYVDLGVSASVSRINGNTRTGFGPRGGVGLDVAVTPEIGAFLEMSATIILPGDAVDHIATSGGSDILTFAEVGVRYRLKAW